MTFLLTLNKLIYINILFLLLSVELFSFKGERRGQATMVAGGVLKKRSIIKNRFRPIKVGELIRGNDILKTSSNGRLKVTLFNNKTILHLYPGSYLEVKVIADYEFSINLVYGKVLIGSSLKDMDSKEYIVKLKTPLIDIISLEGRHSIVLEHNKELEESMVAVLGGKFNIRSRRFASRSIAISGDSVIIISNSSNISIKNIKELEGREQLINRDIFDNNDSLSSFDIDYTNGNGDPFFKVDTSYIDRIADIRKFREKDIFYFKFELGGQYIADRFYFYFSLNPLLSINKLRLQLRTAFYMPIVNTGIFSNWYNYDEWNFDGTVDIFDDLLNKIDYLSYGRRGRDFYLLISSIELVTLGHGLTVHRYTNEASLPKKRHVGFFYDLDFRTIRVAGFISDLTRFEVLGFRVESMPFFSSAKSVYDNVIFGLVFSMDSSPKDNGGNPRVFLFSLDVNIPLLSKKPASFSLSTFFEVASQAYLFNDSSIAVKFNTTSNKLHFIDDSFGLLFGLKGTFLNYGIYRLEYRYLPGGYISRYYDTFYEIYRVSKADQFLYRGKHDFHGFLFGLGVSIPNTLDLYIEYYYESGEIPGYDKVNNSFYIEFSTSKYFLPLFMVKLRYTRRGFNGIEDFFIDFLGSNSYLTLEAQYAFNKHIDLIVGYHTFFTGSSNGYTDRDQVFITVRGTF